MRESAAELGKMVFRGYAGGKVLDADSALTQLVQRLEMAEGALKEIQSLADQILVAAWTKPTDG